MDKSNGNGVYAVRPNSSNGQMDNDNGLIGAGAPATTSTTTATAGTGASTAMMATTNNISIMNGAAAAAAASASGLPTSASSEDLSQSLSEYTDADESISAPTEFLAEVSVFHVSQVLEKRKRKLPTKVSIQTDQVLGSP